MNWADFVTTCGAEGLERALRREAPPPASLADALVASTERSDVELARILLEYGAPVDAMRSAVPLGGIAVPGRSALTQGIMRALEEGAWVRAWALVDLFAERGADLDLRDVDNEGPAPLAVAAAHHAHELVERLLAAGADVRVPGSDGPPLTAALGRPGGDAGARAATVAALLAAKAPLEAPGADGRGPLERAAGAGDLDGVAQLLEAGVSVRSEGERAARAAAAAGRLEVLARLFEAGAPLTDDLRSLARFFASDARGEATAVLEEADAVAAERPEDPEVYRAASRAAQQTGDLEAACAWASRGLDATGAEGLLSRTLSLQLATQRFEEGLTTWRVHGAPRSPLTTEPSVVRAAALCFLRASDAESGVAALERWFQDTPRADDDGGVALAAASLYAATGRVRAGLRELEDALARGRAAQDILQDGALAPLRAHPVGALLLEPERVETRSFEIHRATDDLGPDLLPDVHERVLLRSDVLSYVYPRGEAPACRLVSRAHHKTRVEAAWAFGEPVDGASDVRAPSEAAWTRGLREVLAQVARAQKLGELDDVVGLYAEWDFTADEGRRSVLVGVALEPLALDGRGRLPREGLAMVREVGLPPLHSPAQFARVVEALRETRPARDLFVTEGFEMVLCEADVGVVARVALAEVEAEPTP